MKSSRHKIVAVAVENDLINLPLFPRIENENVSNKITFCRYLLIICLEKCKIKHHKDQDLSLRNSAYTVVNQLGNWLLVFGIFFAISKQPSP